MFRFRGHARIHVLAVALALAPVAGTLVTGCASKTTTVTTERTNEDGETETTVTKETEVERPTGIISSGFNLIGDIIALPFRLVAAVVQLIF